MNLVQKIIQALQSQGQTLAVAESCTGGLVANRITDVPGSSDVFLLGVITYSNEAKQKILNIPPKALKSHGAVSEQIAIAMAKGVRKIHKTDFGIGITGIAGPTGGTKAKPVGLTYIAVSTKDETLCLHCMFQGTRPQIKKQASTQALELLTEFLST